MGLQDTVYHLEVGAGAVWLRRVLIAVGLLGLALWFNINQFHGFDSAEAMDQAQLAREISRGHGFTTHFIRPLSLAQLRDKAYRKDGNTLAAGETAPPEKRDFTSGVPDTVNPPLYPLALAVLFKITGISFAMVPAGHVYRPEVLINVFNQLCMGLTAWLLFLFGRAMFDERVGWVTAGVFLLGGLTWKFSISGTAVPLAMLLLTFSFYAFGRALLWEEEGSRGRVWGWMLGSGLAIGLAALTDYAVVWLLPIYLVAAGFSFPRRTAALLAALAALWLVLLLPWAIRNAVLTGDPFGGGSIRVLDNGRAYIGNTLLRSYHLRADVSSLIWNEMRVKLIEGLRFHLDEGVKLLGSSAATLFFFAGFAHVFRRKRAQVLRAFALGGLLLLAAGTSFIEPRPEAAQSSNTLFLLWPLTVLFGGAFFFILLDRTEVSMAGLRYAAIGLFVFLNSAGLLLTLLPPSPPYFSYPPYFPPILNYVGLRFESGETIASDIPWAVAWYADRPSLWLPRTPEEYIEINDYVSPVSGLLLTPQSRNAPALLDLEKGQWHEWASLIEGKAIPPSLGLSAAVFLPPSQNEYLLLADRNRWEAPKNASSNEAAP